MAYTTIDDPTIYFTTNLRSGLYGGSDTAFDIGFQPDWIWNKKRSGTGVHSLFDSVRGFGSSGKVLYSNTSGAEATNALIKSVSSTGYTITASSDDTGTMVDWNWKAGGSASSNSNGSITSSVSVNTTAGFSIVSYTGNGTAGATVGHGLGSVPQMLILKGRDQVENWTVYHEGLTSNNYALRLNDTAAQFSQTLSWNDTTPTSSVFTLGGGAGTSDYTNRSGISMIAYCFAEKKGYSKFGSYTGNGNADGPFVYTGFKPAFIMYKNTARAISWLIHDNKRLGYNPDNDEQHPDTNAADGSDDRADILSNGFKIKESSNLMNVSGEQVIYMAFAESPFVNSNGIPNNAR
jgi:hypothetical protein